MGNKMPEYVSNVESRSIYKGKLKDYGINSKRHTNDSFSPSISLFPIYLRRFIILPRLGNPSKSNFKLPLFFVDMSTMEKPIQFKES